MGKFGQLSVKVKSESGFFGYNVPIEVRDSKMRLVKRATYELQAELPVGLYEVSAVLEDGQRHSRLIQIKEGERTPVEFGIRGARQAQVSSQVKTRDAPSYEPPRYSQKIESLPDAEPGPKSALVAELLDVTGASLVREASMLWVFECASALDSVPTALLRITGKKIRISLPISPERSFPYNSCVVKVEETRTGAHAHAWIAPERTVANALQNLLASGYVLRAAEVADEAVELLRYKYSDPTGAALGALILQRVGRLAGWLSRVENLAQDFDWLPDGKVMLALLLYDDEATRDRALELARRASTQRMLYAESYSLLLDLLRRWSRESGSKEGQEAIRELALLAPDIDWESICLSQAVEGGE